MLYCPKSYNRVHNTIAKYSTIIALKLNLMILVLKYVQNFIKIYKTLAGTLMHCMRPLHASTFPLPGKNSVWNPVDCAAVMRIPSLISLSLWWPRIRKLNEGLQTRVAHRNMILCRKCHASTSYWLLVSCSRCHDGNCQTRSLETIYSLCRCCSRWCSGLL